MCFTACHLARMETIVYGSDFADALRYDFRELSIRAETMKEVGGSNIKIIKDFMKKECVQLFEDWKEAGGKPY